ncbi:DUF3108 domain-containing protein [Pelagibacteraceae bacterium]|nr:DUF3108 domain-containing protein [Pelagibacteraceae bacterium]
MRTIFYILLLFIFIPSSILKAEVQNINYYLHINILGVPVKIGEIISYFEITEEEYKLKYDLKSENLIQLISPTKGIGKINGNHINSKLIPENYNYTYERKGKIKSTNIEFLDSDVINSEVIPPFEKSKLTPVTDAMLRNVIDPSTGIILMGDYHLNENCSIDYRIFDGKRRYNLIYTSIEEKDSYKVCTLKRQKLGGFKKDGNDGSSNPFASADQIDAYFLKKDEKYIIDKFITKSDTAELIINVTIQ